MRGGVRSVSLEDALWLNRTSLDKAELLGKIVLLDFFTYGCINCLNVLSDLALLEKEFEAELVVIGVHAGKFAHEKEDNAVREAIKRHKIGHAVINDAQHIYKEAYAIKAWPTQVLINPQGYIVKEYRGEGHLGAIREQIKALLYSYTPSKKSFPVKEEEALPSLLHYPQKIAASAEYLFISHKDEVLVCSHEGEILHRLTGLSQPQGMVYIGETLYIASHAGGFITAVSDDFSRQELWLEGLRNPFDLCSDGRLLYVALAGAHQIKGYDLKSKEVSLVIGRENSESLHDGSYAEAVLAQPCAMALLDEELWFVDSESSSLRCAAYGEVTSHLCNDELQHPMGIAAGLYGEGCGAGRIFISDSYNNALKVYDPLSKELKTLLEDLAEPSGIAKKGCMLYICNTNAHEIIRYDLSSMHASQLILKEK